MGSCWSLLGNACHLLGSGSGSLANHLEGLLEPPKALFGGVFQMQQVLQLAVI